MNVFDAAVFGDPKFESYDIKVRSETDLAQIEYLLARNNPVNDVDVLGMFLDKWSQSGCENTSAGTMFCNDWKCTKETSEMSCKLKKGLINPHIYEGMCETRVYGYADTVGAGGASLRSCACCQTFLKKCEKTNKNKGKPWQPSIFEVCAYAKGGYNEGDPYFPELYFKTKEECENYGKKTK